MRAFVGIGLPSPWREALAECAARARDADPRWRDARWVPAENLHITCVFLGDIAEATASPLLTGFGEALADVSPFTLTLADAVVGAPRQRSPRMLWATFRDPSGTGGRAVSALEEVASIYGIETEDRPFRPHVTLARARRPRPFGGLPEGVTAAVLAAHLPEGPPYAMSVGEVTLYASTLTKSGAVYERIADIPLGGR